MCFDVTGFCNLCVRKKKDFYYFYYYNFIIPEVISWYPIITSHKNALFFFYRSFICVFTLARNYHERQYSNCINSHLSTRQRPLFRKEDMPVISCWTKQIGVWFQVLLFFVVILYLFILKLHEHMCITTGVAC